MSNEQAERYKAQGNTALQGGLHDEAVRLYTLAIREDPFCEVYFSNRSAAYAALKRFTEALEDADEAIQLKRDWVKGHMRRGAALAGMKKHEEAHKAYKKACVLEPANPQLRQQMETEEKLATEAREKAKDWENDLWSDDEEGDAGGGGGGDGAGGSGDGDGQLTRGTRVLISALASRAELNGTMGVIEEWNASSGRFNVKLEATGETLGLKPANLTPQPGGKRGAPDGEGEGGGPPRKRRAGKQLMHKLGTSLADASRDTLRVCLQQLCAADEHLAERTLHMLEGLNENSSNGEDNDDDDAGSDDDLPMRRGSGGGGGGGGPASWPKAPAMPSAGSRKAQHGDADDSD